jgi:hypothetical protein
MSKSKVCSDRRNTKPHLQLLADSPPKKEGTPPRQLIADTLPKKEGNFLIKCFFKEQYLAFGVEVEILFRVIFNPEKIVTENPQNAIVVMRYE